jgi:O-antigen/teichoic acid export membrane protein
MRAGRYFIATIAQSLGAFLFLALLSRLLSPGEFGKWVLVEPLVLLGTQIALFGANHGVIKLTAQDGYGASRSLLAVYRRVAFPILLVACVAAVISFNWLSRTAMDLSVAVWLVCEAALVLVLSAFRGADQPSGYVVAVLVRVGMCLAGLLGFHAAGGWFPATAADAAAWWAMSALTGLAAASVYLYRDRSRASQGRVNSTPPREVVSGAVVYGLPILLSTIMNTVVSNGDRYVLAYFANTEDVGQFAVMAKVAGALNLLLAPIALWWPTARFKHIADPDGGATFFGRSSIQLTALFLAASGGLWLIAPILVGLIAPHVRINEIVLLSLVASACISAMVLPLNIGTLKEGRTHWLFIATTCAAIVQIIMAFILVGRIGMAGAALATLCGAITNFVLLVVCSQMLHKVEFPYARMAFNGFVIISSVIVATVVAQNALLRVAIYVTLIACFAAANSKSFFSSSELSPATPK